jgi:acetyl-CoA decarbonylase/synthase complex subunit gamma
LALSGLQIFQLLPRTNCKECGYPTCLAFAMKLATMAESIGKCPDASDAVKAALGAAAEPPIRTLKVGPEAAALSLGGETVCFRHEKTFVNRPAFAIGVQDVAEPAALTAELKRLAGFQIQRIGEELGVDMVWLRAAGGDFVAAAQVLRDGWPGAVVLDSPDTEALRSAADLLRDRRPVLFGATSENLDVLSKAALETGGALVVSASCAKALAPLTERANAAGLKDLLLHVDERSGARAMAEHTIIRRAALRKRFRPLGYPVIARIPEGVPDPALDAVLAVCKYA